MDEMKQLLGLRKKLLALQMEYVVHLVTDESRSIEEALSYTEARYFTVGLSEADEDVALWKRLVCQAKSLFECDGSRGFLEKSWECVWSEPVRKRVSLDWKSERQITSESYAGFTYEYHGEYFKAPQPELLTLHFRNAFVPDSPFRHIQELLDALKQILNEVRQHRPDISRVQCASWLNNVPAFNGLFPESWLKNSKVVPIEGNSGWWGQFIDREGNIHPQRAKAFRETWKFEWPNRMCTCDIDEVVDFLSYYRKHEC